MEINGTLMNYMKNKHFQNMYITCFDEKNHSDLWRIYVLKHLYENVYVSKPNCNHWTKDERRRITKFGIKVLPKESISQVPVMMDIHRWHNITNFNMNYKPNTHIINFYKSLKNKMRIDNHLKDVVFINRKKTRVIYDIATEQPMELTLLIFGVKCCYFEDMTPEEQISFVKEARVVIGAHGVGLVNAILFTHEDCQIVEINLRKWWFCEPICHDHKNNLVQQHVDCKKRRFPFHKADYHNTAQLFGKSYVELEADRYDIDLSRCNYQLDKNIYISLAKLLPYLK